MKYLVLLGWCLGVALATAFPNGSLLRLLGGLLFAGCSLALLFLCVRFAVRSLRSGRRGVGLAMVGGLVLLVALFAFHRLARPGDKAEIEKTIATVTTSASPAYCDDEVTPRYLEQTTGTKPPFADEVCKSKIEASRADSVATSEVGVEGNRATAMVAYTGGSLDGSKLAVALVKDDGKWRLDRLIAFRRFDRAKFDRAYRLSFLAFGSPTSSADCALAKARRFSNAEIETAELRDSPRVFTPIFVACDRDGAERNLVQSIAEPKFDLPPKAIQCAASKIKALGDAELVRLHLDPLAYSELVYSCGRKAVFKYLGRELKDKENLDPQAVDCVLAAFGNRPVAGAIRLSYEQDRYNALIARCR